MSSTLVLQSAGLQAVRVNLMYLGLYGYGFPGPNKCTSGAYDDTDDLVISVKSNAMASMAISGKDKRHDDVQGAIVDVKRADDEAAALVKLNGSIRAKDVEDGSGSSKKSKKKGKSDKEAVISANTVSATSKYVCEKHGPLDAVICAKGDEKDDKCLYDGQSCGRKGRTCHFAECAGEEATD